MPSKPVRMERRREVNPRPRKKRRMSQCKYVFNDEHWSSSDDESLAKIALRPTENIQLVTNLSSQGKCCFRDCNKIFSIRAQQLVFKQFMDAEKNKLGDRYLANCVQRKMEVVSDWSRSPQLLQHSSHSISAEIASEANGDRNVSDEIENAIRESLRDQQPEDWSARTDQLEWSYSIECNASRRDICERFMLGLFHIQPERISSLKIKILNGIEPFSTVRNNKCVDVWTSVRMHLMSHATKPVPSCNATPPHICLVEKHKKRVMYTRFLNFYLEETGALPDITFSAYRRFLQVKERVVFGRRKNPGCCGTRDIQDPSNSKGNNLKQKYNGYRVSKALQRNEVKLTTGACSNGSKVSFKSKSSAAQKVTVKDSLHVKKPKASRNSKKLGNPAMVEGMGAPEGILLSSLNYMRQQRLGKKSGNKDGKLGRMSVNSKMKNRCKGDIGRKKASGKRGDVFSLIHTHLKILPSISPKACHASPHHRYLDPTRFNIPMLFEEYRKYFLNATKSELGLRYATYETIVQRNPTFAIEELASYKECPRCHTSGISSLHNKSTIDPSTSS